MPSPWAGQDGARKSRTAGPRTELTMLESCPPGLRAAGGGPCGPLIPAAVTFASRALCPHGGANYKAPVTESRPRDSRDLGCFSVPSPPPPPTPGLDSLPFGPRVEPTAWRQPPAGEPPGLICVCSAFVF